MKDFLNLPGQTPEKRPSVGDRSNVGNKASIGNKANIGDRENNVGNRVNIKTGGKTVNIGSGNRVNRQHNTAALRNKWAHVNNRPFNSNWWGRHPHSGAHWRWHSHWNRHSAGWCWRPATWATFGTWFAWSWSKPYRYDYGNTVVYQDNSVHIDGKEVASAEVYYDQAEEIAQSVPKDVDAEKVEWMPLGVFAITEESATDSGLLLQLAVSKEGIIAGTLYNETTDASRPVEGMVDQKTQRAAWQIADGSNPGLVMETGIYNLTEDEATALVHFDKAQTQTWLMVRLPEPEGEQE